MNYLTQHQAAGVECESSIERKLWRAPSQKRNPKRARPLATTLYSSKSVKTESRRNVEPVANNVGIGTLADHSTSKSRFSVTDRAVIFIYMNVIVAFNASIRKLLR